MGTDGKRIDIHSKYGEAIGPTIRYSVSIGHRTKFLYFQHLLFLQRGLYSTESIFDAS